MKQETSNAPALRFNHILFVSITLLVAAVVFALLYLPPAQADVTVYKSPYCGCCVKWVEHLEGHGFTVDVVDETDMNRVKQRFGVPARLGSCHTAIMQGGQVIEGHVPAAAIQRMLESHADIYGLAVPGMPIGSPGMEGPNPQDYEVLAFDERGIAVPFSSHEGQQ